MRNNVTFVVTTITLFLIYMHLYSARNRQSNENIYHQ